MNKLVIGCTVHFIGQFHAKSIVAGRMQEVGIEQMMNYNDLGQHREDIFSGLMDMFFCFEVVFHDFSCWFVYITYIYK